MKKVAITGINGFLGGHLAHMLSSQFEVIGIVRDKSKTNLPVKFQLYNSNVNDIRKLFEQHELYSVIHTATVYRTDSIDKMLNSNVVLPTFLYEECLKNRVKFFLNTDTFFNVPEADYNYLSTYTLSKKTCLDWLKILNTQDCKLINLKLFHVYGPGDGIEKFVPSMIQKLKGEVESIELTPGDQQRDFIHVDDVCSAYLCVLLNIDMIEDSFKEFEVGTGTEVSIKNFLETAKRVLKSSSFLNFGALEHRNNEIMSSYSNIENLNNLGWSPQVSLEMGIMTL